MNKRQQLKRAVIEAIHGLPYEEAIQKEGWQCEFCNWVRLEAYPITIGRVVQALANKWKTDSSFIIELCLYPISGELEIKKDNYSIFWKLTKENGQECTDNDQTDETIDKLFNLLK